MSRKFKVPIGLAPLGSNPAAGSTGDAYFHTGDKLIKVYDGSNWVTAQGTQGLQGTQGIQGTQGVLGATGVEVAASAPSTDKLWLDTTATTDQGVSASSFDAKGDLLVGTADNAYTRLAVGSNNQVLMADSSATSGLKFGSVGSKTLISRTNVTNGATSVQIHWTDTDYEELIVLAKVSPDNTGSVYGALQWWIGDTSSPDGNMAGNPASATDVSTISGNYAGITSFVYQDTTALVYVSVKNAKNANGVMGRLYTSNARLYQYGDWSYISGTGVWANATANAVSYMTFSWNNGNQFKNSSVIEVWGVK